MLSFLLTAFLFAAASPLAPASITGPWILKGEVQDVAFTAQCNFVQSGKVLTGTCGDETATHPLKGTVVDNAITFSLDSTYNDDAITMNYSGKLDAEGKLTGSIDVEPFGADGSFTASRAPASAQK